MGILFYLFKVTRWHVSAPILGGHHHVTKIEFEETIQCMSLYSFLKFNSCDLMMAQNRGRNMLSPCHFEKKNKILINLRFVKSVHHRTIQINHQPEATIFLFIILAFIYSSTCFGRFPAHHQELNDCSDSLWFYLRIVVTVVLCSWSGRSACQSPPSSAEVKEKLQPHIYSFSGPSWPLLGWSLPLPQAYCGLNRPERVNHPHLAPRLKKN